MLPPEETRTDVDRWLLSRHEACREEVDTALEGYRFDDAARAAHRFLWSEFCDWGLEMSKHRLYEGSERERASTAATLAWILERSLRLLHPLMPFVTEEIWQRFGIEGSVMVEPWPKPHPELRDAQAEERFDFAEQLVVAIRSFRSGHGLGPGTPLTVRVRGDDRQRSVLATLDEEIRRVGRIEALEVLDGATDGAGHARMVVDGAEVLVPLAGLLDPEAECARLRKRLDELALEADRAARKLDNPGFTQKAPPSVVEKERRKLAEREEERSLLDAQLAELGC